MSEINPPTPSAVEKDVAITKTAPSQIAHIQLAPSKFFIKGPVELIVLTESIINSNRNQDPEVTKYHVMDLWADWYVQCSVSQEWISLADLKYWDVEKQTIYARPELVPAPIW